MTIIIYLQEIDIFAQRMVLLHPHTFGLDNCHQDDDSPPNVVSIYNPAPHKAISKINIFVWLNQNPGLWIDFINNEV